MVKKIYQFLNIHKKYTIFSYITSAIHDQVHHDYCSISIGDLKEIFLKNNNNKNNNNSNDNLNQLYK